MRASSPCLARLRDPNQPVGADVAPDLDRSRGPLDGEALHPSLLTETEVNRGVASGREAYRTAEDLSNEPQVLVEAGSDAGPTPVPVALRSEGVNLQPVSGLPCDITVQACGTSSVHD